MCSVERWIRIRISDDKQKGREREDENVKRKHIEPNWKVMCGSIDQF